MPFAAAKTQMAMRMFNAPPTLSKNDVNGRVPMSLEQNNANKTANLNASTVHSVGMTKYKRYAIPSAPKAVFNTLAAPSHRPKAFAEHISGNRNEPRRRKADAAHRRIVRAGRRADAYGLDAAEHRKQHAESPRAEIPDKADEARKVKRFGQCR